MAETNTTIKINVDASQVERGTAALGGMDDALNKVGDQASTTASQTDRATVSVGKMAGGVALGTAALQAAKEAFRFVTEATREYVRENARAQEQVEGITEAYTEFKTALGRSVVEIGLASGAINALTSALRLLGSTMDALAQTSASGIGGAASEQANRTARGLVTLSEQRIDEIETELSQYSAVGRFFSVEAASLNKEREMLEERIATLRSNIESGQRVITAAQADDILYSSETGGGYTEGALTGHLNNVGRPTGGRSAGPSSEELKARAMEQLDIIRQQNEASLKAMDAENARNKALAEQNLLIENNIRLKEESLAADLAAAEAATAAADQLKQKAFNLANQEAADKESKVQAIGAQLTTLTSGMADSIGNMFGEMASGSNKDALQAFADNSRKVLGGMIRDLGMIAVQAGIIKLLGGDPASGFFPNPSGGVLIGAGSAAIALGSALGAGGGKGGKGSGNTISPAQPSTVSENRTFNVTNNIGMSTDPRATAQAITKTLDTGTRQGIKQRR